MTQTIESKGKFAFVSEGQIDLKYDNNIKRWFKQFDEELHEIIFMNDGTIAKEIGKLLGVKKVETTDYPYWDEFYMSCMSFYVEGISDTKIRKALKNKTFTIKLKVEDL